MSVVRALMILVVAEAVESAGAGGRGEGARGGEVLLVLLLDLTSLW